MWFTWALGRITKDDHCLNKKAERPMGALKIFRSPWLVTTPTATFPEIFNGLLFRSILWMCTRNLKFVTFSSSWDNRGTQKNLGNPWIRPRTLYSKDFNGLLFWWTLWMYRPILLYTSTLFTFVYACKQSLDHLRGNCSSDSIFDICALWSK